MSNLGKSQIPNYEKIEIGARNNHRLNFDDERAAVRGYFHQFNFFNWNQDIMNIFSKTEPLFQLKKQVTKLLQSKYIVENKISTLDYKQSRTPLIDRVSFQYYPRGWGYLGKHVDPININQSIVPTIVMSEFGKDYKGGGFFLEYKEKVYYPEKNLSPGDILIFNPIYPHGVETIDQEYKKDSIIAEYTNQVHC